MQPLSVVHSDACLSPMQKLQHANQVLQQKLDTDGRLHRQAQASAAKERLQLEEQVRGRSCLPAV